MTIILLILAISFPFIYKYSYAVNIFYEHMPVIQSFLDSEYLTGDFYTNAVRSFGPRTFFAFYMAKTSVLLTLPGTFFFHYVLFIFITNLATFKLSKRIFGNDYISLLTVITVLFGSTISLGGNYLITRDLISAHLPMGLLLLGSIILFEKKILQAALCFSIASYLHPQVGIVGGFIVYLAYLFCNKTRATRTIISFLMFAASIIPLFFLYKNELDPVFISTNKNKLIDIVVYMRLPHHMLPSSWPSEHYLWFIAMLIFFYYYLWRHIKKNRYLTRYLFALSMIIILLCFIGYVGTEWFPVYPIIISQFYRFTVLIYWMSAVLIYGNFYNQVFVKNKNRLFLMFPLFIPIIRNFQPSKAFIASMAVLIFLVFFSRQLPKYLFIILMIMAFGLQHYHERLNLNSIIGHPTTETTLALWVKNNTPKNSFILSPPDFEKFRVVSERAIVVDRKSFPFEKNAMLEWGKRMCDIANQLKCNLRKLNLSVATSGYNSLTLMDLKRLQKKYGFEYFVGRNELPLKSDYSDSGFHIYKLPGLSGQ